MALRWHPEHSAGNRKLESRQQKLSKRRWRRRPQVELLENRILLSTFHWLNDADGDFSVAGNWQENAVPGAGDDAIIAFSDITVTSAVDQSINSLACSGSLKITSGTFTLAAASSIDKDLTLTGGTLTGAGDVTVSGTLDWQAGTMSGSGATFVPSGTTFLLNSGTLNRTLHNAVAVTWSGSFIDGSGLFDNQASATFIASPVSIPDWSPSFVNAGVFESTVDCTFGSPNGTFDSTGSVDVRSGTLTLEGTITSEGTVTVDAGALLTNSGGSPLTITGLLGGAGNVQFNGPVAIEGSYAIAGTTTIAQGSNSFDTPGGVTIPTLVIKSGGEMTGSADITITGTLDWRGGTMSGSGATFVPAGTSFLLNSGTLNRTLHNAVAVTWSGSNLGGSGLFDNQASATFIASPVSIPDWSPSFANAGVFESTVDCTFGSTNGTFDSTGGVDVRSGTLTVEGTIIWEGAVTVEGLLQNSGGSPLTITGPLSGAGDVRFNGPVAIEGSYAITGTTTIAQGSNSFDTPGGVTFPTLVMNGGDLTGSADITVTGTFDWQRGGMSGAGTTFVPSGTTFLLGAGPTLNRTLHNATLATWSGGNMAGSGLFDNQASATFIASLTSGGRSDWSPSFTNDGAFVAFAASGVCTFGNSNTRFDSTGSVEINDGPLFLDGNITWEGSVTVNAGARLENSGGSPLTITGPLSGAGDVRFNGPVSIEGSYAITGTTTIGQGLNSFDTPGGVTIPTLVIKSGGELTGSADITVTGSFDWPGGTMSGSGTTFVPSGATFTLGGGDLERTLHNAASATWDGGNRSGSGLFDNQASATFTASIASGTAGSWSPPFANEGTVIQTAGGQSGVVTFGDFNNSGTLDVQAGTLEVLGAFPSLAGSTLQIGTYLISGVLQISQGTIVSNAATIVLDGPGAAIVDGSGADMLASLTTNAAGGSLTIQNGRNFTTAGALANAGSLTVGAASTLSVQGDYTQSTDAALSVAIGGDPTSGQFGQLNASGVATLDGSFNLELVNGFAPQAGQSFTIMSYASTSGQFSTLNGFNLGRTQAFALQVQPTQAILTTLVDTTDLAVDHVDVPASANPGASFTVHYTVNNLPGIPVSGDWIDSLYLSLDDKLDPSDVLLTRVQHQGGVSGSSYSEDAPVTLPGVLDGDFHVILVSDSRGLVPDVNRANNIGASNDLIRVRLPILPFGGSVTDTIKEGQDLYFHLDVPPGTDALLTADFAVPNQAEVFARFGAVPDLSNFDENTDSANSIQQVVLPARAGTYVIWLHGLHAAGGGLDFSLSARSTFGLTRVSPNHGSNVGQATLTLTGSGFTSATTISLIAGDRSRRDARSVALIDGNTLSAVFDLTGLQPGTYDVSAEDANHTSVAGAAFKVTAGIPGEINFFISGPEKIRLFEDGVVTIHYTNIGDTDVPAPLFTVEAQNAHIALADQAGLAQEVRIFLAFAANHQSGGPTVVFRPTEEITAPPARELVESISFLGISPTGPAGILPPGGSGEVKIRFLPDGFGAHVMSTFTIEIPDSLDAPVDYTGFESGSRPPQVSADAWHALFTNFNARTGSTVGQLQAALDDAATALSLHGQHTNQLDRLFSFAIAQSDTGLGSLTLASTRDAAAPAPGAVPLALDRAYPLSIVGRYQEGLFGRGWATFWDTSAGTDALGDVVIRTPQGFRVFTPHLVQVTNTGQILKNDYVREFFGTLGDPAIAQRNFDGSVVLKEKDGRVLHFRPDGKLREVDDTNGNIVTANYDSAGRLISLVHSDGDQFLFSYNSQGRVSQLTDQAGQITTYTYDASGEHLVSVSGPSGTLSYGYVTGVSAGSEHALASVTNLDGSHVFYTYDDQGRLAHSERDNGIEPFDYVYPAEGEVTITDALNNPTTLVMNDAGQVVTLRDALDRTVKTRYDASNRPVNISLPGGLSITQEFDQDGNLIHHIDPQGQTIESLFKNEAPFGSEKLIDRLFNLDDEKGNRTRYNYDAQGNLLTRFYADGTSERFTFDALGNVVSYRNRNGQTIRYTYNQRGQLTRQDHDNGAHEDFSYDDRGNLLSMTDSTGTTTYTYDSGNRLTQVTYLSGRFLHYTYDSGGRRTQMIDQDGFGENYTYDAAGRLSQVTDSAGALIAGYTYDAAGRLARKDLGNGTFSTYEYDQAGQLLHVVNHAPDGTVNSQFDYTYDELGRRTGMTTLDGQWNYTYDALGQLIHAVFHSTNPALVDQDLRYTYDTAGNRTQTIVNGVTTDYATNGVDEYTQVGGLAYSYDSDGNLVAQGNGNSYTYDDQNRLVSVTTPAGTWTYQYDALGNRVAATHNGQRTDYLLDPTGLVNVVGEYDSSGNPVAHYTYGLGLASRVAGKGASFYDFDAVGSTAGITDTTGAYVDRYSYLPFGDQQSKSGSLANPFTFVGQFGVMQEGNGLDFMRARYYSTSDGRFVSPDPISILGGVNLYRYASNNPQSRIDPLGLADPPSLPPLTPAEIDKLLLEAKEIILAVQEEALELYVDENVQVLARVSIPGTIPILYNAARLIALAPQGAALVAAFGAGYAAGSIAVHFFPSLGTFAADLACKISGACDPDGSFTVEQIAPGDPNDIVGPGGFGSAKFVTPDQVLPYQINFENKPDASAPAQAVVIKQQLDPDLDPHTFELGTIGFGGIVVDVPPGHNFFSTRVELPASPDTGGSPLFVDVTAGIDLETGLATWTFTSLDPATLDLPANVLAGILPPDRTMPEGEGFVTYTVRPRASSPTGARLDAQAGIVFDTNAEIDTAAIFNTVDSGAPSSSVTPLPATESSTSFTVSWSGQDDTGGSGIASFDVFVSDNGGPFNRFLTATTQTSTTFTGVLGHTYGFYSVALDNVGNRQPTPTAAQATTRVVQSDPNTAFVTALYHDILNRLPDSDGLAGWVHGLQLGASRLLIAKGIWESVEHRGQEVDSYYETYLHRAADKEGRAGWVQAFENGLNETQVQFFFATSLEYQLAHPSADAYITALYADVLGRQPDAGGLANWERVAALPMGRAIIALGFLESTEEDLRVVDGYYAAFLGRHADAPGEQGWLASLQLGLLSPGQVAEYFLASPEYFARVAG